MSTVARGSPSGRWSVPASASSPFVARSSRVEGIRRPYHDLKDFFQISEDRWRGRRGREKIVRVADPRALHALAHPTRVALLDHLLAMGARTASQCAEAVGESASSCSWHMRQLARFGFVERAESTDGRERPWRATATGFGYEPGRAGPGDERLENAVLATQLRSRGAGPVATSGGAQRAGAGVAGSERRSHLPPADDTRRARGAAVGLDQAIRPFISLTRADAPEDAARSGCMFVRTAAARTGKERGISRRASALARRAKCELT